MASMTWEQKLSAMQALGEVRLKMRRPGEWYVSQSVEISDGHICSGNFGQGTTPKQAVEQHWEIYSNAHPISGKHVVSGGFGPDSKRVYWNGHMWESWRSPNGS